MNPFGVMTLKSYQHNCCSRWNWVKNLEQLSVLVVRDYDRLIDHLLSKHHIDVPADLLEVNQYINLLRSEIEPIMSGASKDVYLCELLFGEMNQLFQSLIYNVIDILVGDWTLSSLIPYKGLYIRFPIIYIKYQKRF